ncbi:MAG: NUDIX domain-containing protein [Anaerolineae bacterium]
MRKKLIEKAVPVVLRQSAHGVEILVFEHPIAGRQLVKGSVEPNESAEDAAVRELAEESGLIGVSKTIFLGDQIYNDSAQQWFFFRCLFDRKLPDQWEFFTQDDGGHLFKFHWRPIEDKIDNPAGPIFELAREFIEKSAA